MQNIRKVGVIGAGVMGAAIAAHLANAGLDVLLLDRVPEELTDEELRQGLTLKDRPVRLRLARQGLERALDRSPAAFFTRQAAQRVTPGNLTDDIALLGDCQWVLEAIVENVDAKRELLTRLAPHLGTETVLTSNTSGLSLAVLAEALDEKLRVRFFGTHFFNPPRYLRLLELIPCPHTDASLLATFGEFARRRLGKGIVVGKDTPNFVANRIGVYVMLNAIRHMHTFGLSVAEVDAITGPVMGRPKTGIFRTIDLVGIDTLVHVTRHSRAMLQDDEEVEAYRVPEFLEEMAARGLLGDKAGAGFYRRDKDGRRQVYDPSTESYRPLEKPQIASLVNVGKIADPALRVAALLAQDDAAARYAWAHLRDILLYAMQRVPEIAEHIEDVDHAMCWGYNWELGPFGILDAIGVDNFVRRVEADGLPVPEGLREISAFYTFENGAFQALNPVTGDYRPVPVPDGDIDLRLVRAGGGVIETVQDGSLLDLGDGVLCLEFHGKKNTLGSELLALTRRAVARAERDGVALVVGNQGALFSAGANLALLSGAMEQGRYQDIEKMIQAFQAATMALKYATVPVVAAPFQLALGGGCEYVLHAAAVTAHAETYMGLVEVGVGLLPAGGGTKEMALRALAQAESYQLDASPFLFKAFEHIGMGTVSKSADELFELGYLRRGDRVAMNPGSLLAEAKQHALTLAATYRPPQSKEWRAPGSSVLATMKSRLWNLEMAGYISCFDRHIGGLIAEVLCGGNVPPGTAITEDYLLALERENFLRLCGEERTLARIKHMLAKGKPLRN